MIQPATHPAPETLAEFIDGKLAGDTRDAVTEHIEECDDCLMIVGETSRLLDEAPAGKRTIQHRYAPWLLAAAIAGIVLLPAWLLREQLFNRDPLIRLTRASRSLHIRPIEPRLHSFPYAPLSPRGDNATDSALLRLHGVAGEILQEHDQAREDAKRQHAAGLAALVTGHASDAISLLQRAVELTPDDANAWSDLAAAFYESGRHNNDPQQFVDALAAADHALNINPQSPDARFNRALTLEALHLPEAAAAEYDAYLLLDSASDWAAEVRARLRTLRAKRQGSVWNAEKPALDHAALSGDAKAVLRIVAAHRHDARAYGELVLLNQWARNIHDTAALNIARAIGTALYAVSGERLLADAVKAIDSARESESEALADAHRTYYDARVLYSQGRPAEAQLLFARAATRFHEGVSPMEAVARYYISSCLYNTNHGAEALKLVDALYATAGDEYVALRGQLIWNRATILARDGDVYEVLRCQRESLALLDRIGETTFAEEMRGALAATESVLGRRAEAWRTRWSLFERTSASGNRDAQQMALELAARTEAMSRRWDRAHSLLVLALEPPSRMSAWLTSNALIWRALAANRLAWNDQAQRDLSEARRVAQTVRDAAERSAATDMVLFASGVVTSESDATRAAELLSRYIDQASARHDRALLAEAFIERAKARRRLNQHDAALADVRSAIEWLSQRREQTAGQEYRDAYFATGDAAVRLAVDLLDARGDTDGALSLLERSRVSQPGATTARPTPGVVVIEYLALDDRLLIFVRTHESIRLVRVVVTAKMLEATVGAWLAQLNDTRASAELAKWLISPVEELARAQHVVIIPDAAVLRVPFAALPQQSGEPLIASMPVAIAPDIVSATAPSRNAVTDVVLVVGDPAFDSSTHSDLNRLPHAAAEAEDVAALYKVTPLVGEAASKAAVLQALTNATLFHLAAHSVIAAADTTTSAILLGGDDLYVRELQSLHLARLRTAVLTSCQTAATIDNGGDPSSVALAFLRAGAQNVIASMWDVDDRIGQRVGLALHRELLRGADAATALQRVQLAMFHSSDPALRNPRAWAGYRVYGNGL